jgi:hypothetical protein
LLLVSRGEDSAGAEGSGDGLCDIVGLFRSINRFRTAGGLVAGCLFVQPCCRNVLVAQSLAFLVRCLYFDAVCSSVPGSRYSTESSSYDQGINLYQLR